MSKKEYSVIVPQDEPAVLHRGYYGVDYTTYEDYRYRICYEGRFYPGDVYAAENHLQRECVRKWGKRILIQNAEKANPAKTEAAYKEFNGNENTCNPSHYTYGKVIKAIRKLLFENVKQLSNTDEYKDIKVREHTYGTSKEGNDLIAFEYGDLDNPDAKHITLVANLGGNQQFSKKVIFEIMKAQLANVSPKGLIYHIIPEPNPDKSKKTEKGVLSIFNEDMTNSEVQAVGSLYRALHYMENELKKEPDICRTLFCWTPLEYRGAMIESLLSKAETGKSLYTNLTKYPNLRQILFMAINGRNPESDDEAKKYFSEDRRKEIVEYYSKLFEKYKDKCIPSLYSPSCSKLDHVNSGYNEKGSVEQQALIKYIKKYAEKSILIENMTGAGNKNYPTSNNNRLGLIMALNPITTGYVYSNSESETGIDYLRNAYPNSATVTQETGKNGSDTANSISTNEENLKLVNLLVKQIDDYIKRARSVESLSYVNKLLVDNTENIPVEFKKKEAGTPEEKQQLAEIELLER